MKRLFRIALWVLAALFVIVITLALNEVLIFASRTEASAQGQAKQDFLSECARRGLNPSEFTGPLRIKSPPGTFGFVWVNPSDGNQIATMVKYFPADAVDAAASGVVSKTLSTSLRGNGSRECAPDDRLREAIHRAAKRRMDCFVAALLAMTVRAV